MNLKRFFFSLIFGILTLSAFTQNDAPTIDAQRFTSALTNNQYMISAITEPLPNDEVDPVMGMTYRWAVYGYMQFANDGGGQLDTRFAVYCQSQNEIQRAKQTAAMLLRLLDFNLKYIKRDHPMSLPIIEVFLCWGGTKTGGEQIILTPEPVGNKPARRRNLIYIYQTSTLTDPLEWLREISHEYGHASLPGITGYTEPEKFANGLLGERLYLRWILRDLEAGRLKNNDAFGIETERLQAWVNANCQTLEQKITANGLNLETLKGNNKDALFEYISLMLFAENRYETKIFDRAVRLTAGNHAENFYKGLKDAIDEQTTISVNLPGGEITKECYLLLPGSAWKCGEKIEMKAMGDGWMKLSWNEDIKSLKFTHEPAP